jgi:hypothetical protein
MDFQDFITRKRFKLFPPFSIHPEDFRWPFLHFTDDLDENRVFSEGFLD